MSAGRKAGGEDRRASRRNAGAGTVFPAGSQTGTRGPAAKNDQLSVYINRLAMDISRLAVYMSRLSVYITRLSMDISRCPWT